MDQNDIIELIQTAAEEKRSELDLSDNLLTVLPAEITQLSQLSTLNLSGNELTALPSEITQLSQLSELNLSNNQLTTLPAEIAQLSQLSELYLSNNQLTALPPEIGQLSQLSELYLSNNRLTALPPEIGQLSQLSELYLSNNQLAALRPEVTQLSQLSALDLSGNQLAELPPEIAQLSQLSSLNLSDNQLTALRPEVTQLSQLSELYLNNNRLAELPPEIAQLSQLSSLNLSGNQLTVLPPEIAQLSHLFILHLSSNQLTALPPEITRLGQLSIFDLGGNQLTALPPEVTQLSHLSLLDLMNNQLTALPPEITRLSRLSLLDLSGNQLTALPPEVTQLNQLSDLYLNDNQLTTLPCEIAILANTTIILLPNPFSDLPPEIVEQGDTAILAYLKELYDGCSQQWVSKLMLVGEGGVGKTSLLCALRGEAFSDTSTTRGIDIRTVELPHTGNEAINLTLNAWDFGGQEIYHATHQFFLTNRSLFLLVWNARHGYEQGKLYYWLDSIQARAPQSPVMVVATWTDERDADLPTADLQRKYPQIIGFYSVSNKNQQGIAELRQAIAQAAVASLPLMGEQWPNSWLKAVEAVRARPEKYITPGELWQIMGDQGVSEAGARVLARWLHELGDILFFRDERDLNDLVILKPQWVSQYIGRVLESDDVIGKLGIFTDEHMDQLWRDLAPSMRQHFLRLMEEFDLSYRTLEDAEVSLVVERLPLDPPDYQTLWGQAAGAHEISMKFKLNTMLPGIPTWFLARSHRFSTHTHWRLGGVFAYESEAPRHLALVQAFPHDREVQLTVRGPSPQNFFALLKDGLEVTFARYPGLKIERTIPCPGHDGQVCSYEFNYETLQKAIEREKPRELLPCGITLEDVSVLQLLYGLHRRTEDQVLAEIREVKTNLTRLEKDSAARHNEMLTLLQREFIKNFEREQSQIETYVPNVFVLHPYHASGWKKLLAGEKMEMQLYCQEPGCWHPTGASGRYVFDYPPKWLRATGGYIQNMVTLLKFVSPLVGPWLGIAAADYAKLIENDIKMMEELVKLLPEIVKLDETSEMKLADKIGIVTPEIEIEEKFAATGSALRAIRSLLEKVDEQQTWGHLKRVLTPENHYLWLCEHHAQAYR